MSKIKNIQRFGVLLLAVFLCLLAHAPRTMAQAPPCCSITAVDNRTGNLAARVNASGETFEFHVADARLLATLRVGQGIYANFTSHQVSLDGKKACCTIVSGPGAAAVPKKGAVATTAGKVTGQASPAPRPIAAEYNSIRRHAKTLIGRLHSVNAADVARTQNEWQLVVRDLQAWANKYHVRLATTTLTSTAEASGTGTPVHLPPADCKDISNLGPDGSAAGDNSAGHCYLQKRTTQVDKYLCTYFCVPAEVVQQPDIDDSPYPSGSSKPLPPQPPMKENQAGRPNQVLVCCGITEIDARTDIVTAKVHQTGQAFTFELEDKKSTSQLQIGQEYTLTLPPNRFRSMGQRSRGRSLPSEPLL